MSASIIYSAPQRTLIQIAVKGQPPTWLPPAGQRLQWSGDSGFLRDADEGGPEQAVLHHITGLHFLDDRAGLRLIARDLDHRLVAVRVERLNQTLFLPTYSETLLGLETNVHLGHAAMLNVNRAIELFITAVKKADATKTE